MAVERSQTLGGKTGRRTGPGRYSIGVVLLGLGLIARAALAGACFCLEDEDDNLRHSCETQHQGVRTVTHCRDDMGEPYPLESLAGWTRLEDGEGRCTPCRQGKIAVKEGPIRGDDDKPPAKGASDDRAR